VTAAAAVGALSMLDASERSADPELEALRARCIAAVRDGFDPAGGFAASVPTAARGLVAWGLVRALELDDSVKRETAEAAVRSVFRETPPSQLASQTPFVVWAELELHPDGAVPSIAVLEEMRSLVWDHQLRRSDLRPMDRDLAGGVVFTRGRAVLPTWQTMRPLAALARMMGDERLTLVSTSRSSVNCRTVPHVRDEHDHGPGAARCPRRAEAQPAAHPVAMNDLNLRPGKKHLKCAKICGNTSGDYHPHGEAVIYPTMVGMAQKWKMRVPLVDPQGNFGSIDGDPPAAMRYTEARMTHAAMDMLAGPEARHG
jgi:hypothetical protein